MEAFVRSFLPRLTVLTVRADVQSVLVSVIGSVKAGLHMSPYRYN